jgi:hypothetical protein
MKENRIIFHSFAHLQEFVGEEFVPLEKASLWHGQDSENNLAAR